MERNRRNRTLLFLAYALQGMVFYNPIATLYRLQAGVTLTQMQVIEGISLLVMLGLEVHWGRWADRIGHRRSMVLCFGVLALSKVVFWRAETVWGFLAERLLLSFAQAGLSGCDTAYLYACCRDPEEHRRAFARWQGVQVAGLLLASLAWPLLGGDYRLSALLTVGSYTLALGVTLLLREPEGQRAEEQAREPRRLWARCCGRAGGCWPFCWGWPSSIRRPRRQSPFSASSSTGAVGLQRGPLESWRP
ncbi:MFS transporter [Clostridium sp. J1101437_171009_A5]|uniref:MFS transporter n=1 Tax=Clostridium sp. J1101437_171009_A5 TaxID=2787098 RepID=UPI0018988447|nr:MFS transporter [Clostridium sp. J1101437_171009_A5]